MMDNLLPALTRKLHHGWRSMLAVAAAAGLTAVGVPAQADFQQDLEALTRTPHRLAGTDENNAAVAYVEQRLAEIGVRDVYPLDMVTWQTYTERCDLTIGGQRIDLLPMMPSLTVPPVTDPEGVTGRLVYAGNGGLEQYGDAFPHGAIVLLDYDSFDHWRQAFALGADAVIFVGEGDETPMAELSAPLPMNLLRFYVSRQQLAEAGLDLESLRGQEATLHSRVKWKASLSRNLVARIPGTHPTFSDQRSEPEAIVLSAPLDSFGPVPELAPGARLAGNVAALLEAAERFVQEPSRRDVVLMFVNNQARYHQGAREVYDALAMAPGQHDDLVAQTRLEQQFVGTMLQILDQHGLGFAANVQIEEPEGEESVQQGGEAYRLLEALKDVSQHARDDIAKELQILRLTKITAERSPEPQIDRLNAQIEERLSRQMQWDDIRRELHRGSLPLFMRLQADRVRGEVAAEPEEVEAAQVYLDLLAELEQRVRDRFSRRLDELAIQRVIDDQRTALRDGLADRWFVLHVDYNLSGDASTWALIVGDWTDRLFREVRLPRPEGDQPGFYGRVLQAFDVVVREMAEAGRALSIDRRSLTDTTLGLELAPGPYVNAGYVAGKYGWYHLAVMTAHDARLRDGHPADTVENLPWQRLHAQAREATAVVQQVADSAGLSLQRVFRPMATSKYPTWSGGRSSGDYVNMQVTGSLSEERPAVGAVMAMWPGNHPKLGNIVSWTTFENALAMPSFQPMAMERVDSNGRFRMIGVDEEMFLQLMTLATAYDEQGRVHSISTRRQQSQKRNEALRVDMFAGRGYGTVTMRVYALKADQLKVLRAEADAAFRDSRALVGQAKGITFFYISDYYVDEWIKLFQPMGPVILGDFTRESPFGSGLPVETFRRPPHLTPQSAQDLWALNEGRLRELRVRGVGQPDLEMMHARSARERDRVRALAADPEAEAAMPVPLQEAALKRATVLSQRVYQPLRIAMDDLVHAIVVLLLLAIPFAFAMERLLVCATTIYGRIVGFTVLFLITFGILYFTHPGFAIASTPIIIFLAFTIILLSSLVIYIVVRKFKVELKAMQGQRVGLHDLQTSHAGTLLAAVSMGMSTMRRRPTRTGLTAITVVALTFTILCFASFSQTIGVRKIPAGLAAQSTRAGLLLRNLDYSAVPEATPTLLRGMAGEGGLVAPQWWVVREDADAPPITITRVDDGRSMPLDAVMGIESEELERWPELAEGLGASRAVPGESASSGVEATRQALEDGGVFLPAIVQELLHLEAGQPILVNGHQAFFAGSIEAAQVQRLRHLDGQSIIPVDFQSASAQGQGGAAQANQQQEEMLLADEVERDFIHLSADSVAVMSNLRARSLGGKLHLISIYPGNSETGEPLLAEELGEQVAQVVVMPVWAAGREGVQRMLLTVLTEVSGGWALLVPLFLGGLIIFGTLLGSISDREKEIYTFSALGLSPTHVGVLFFAEAAVYAIVGGMGGQLLAQFVALIISGLSRAQIISPVAINFSSTNALFAIAVVMATVIVSAIYPATRASKSANPGLARSWRLPTPEGDDLKMTFPFTVSAYDITGVISFLAEHFRRHDDAGLGSFAASNVNIRRTDDGNLELSADLALAPFDLGVTEHLTLTAIPSEIEGVDEVAIHAHRTSGAKGDWLRANKVFLRDLRKQFLLWRTLSNEMIERYRHETLEALGQAPPARGSTTSETGEGGIGMNPLPA